MKKKNSVINAFHHIKIVCMKVSRTIHSFGTMYEKGLISIWLNNKNDELNIIYMNYSTRIVMGVCKSEILYRFINMNVNRSLVFVDSQIWLATCFILIHQLHSSWWLMLSFVVLLDSRTTTICIVIIM